MAPILHCVRHAQGFHNLGVEFHSYPDPKLTPLGEEQCHSLRNRTFSDQSKISLVTASPLSRTLQTAFLVFQPSLEKNQTKILAIPDTQETSDFPCDIGSDASVLPEICQQKNIPADLSLITRDWNRKTVDSRYSPASHAVVERAREARHLLRSKMLELVQSGSPDAQVVLVTHGGFLHYFTDDWEDSHRFPGTGWQNCESRSYVFEDGVESHDQDAYLLETEESRRKRGREHPMLPHEQQQKLFAQSQQAKLEQHQPSDKNLESNTSEQRGEVEAVA